MMIPGTFVKVLLTKLMLIALIFNSYPNDKRLNVIDNSPQVEFAITILKNRIYTEDFPYVVRLQVNSSLEAQSFTIKTQGNEILVEGGNAVGLMYGGLELAELIELRYNLSALSIQKTPDIKNRGLKFNIPLDARCPSYDDTGDAAQKNILNMWDYEFWTAFFDKMALYRYNVLSLWTPNPFQVMTKLPDYPKLALNDVCITTARPAGKVGEWGDAGGVNNTVLDNLKVEKKITIDEKIAFWQKVFAYAETRGIDIYLYTWNIYTNGTFGQYGLTDQIDNIKTKAYYRQAINVFLQTYPQIKGIGVTAGERMHVPAGKDVSDEREKWLWETYGLGILDYKKTNPERKIHFVHRVWYSKFEQIMKYWKDYPDPFEVGFKYVKARIYSSPKESPYIGGLKQALGENKLKCWWNLRNDDIFVYRWGNPDYVRKFISNLPSDVTAGYHMGPDGYVFGKVFSDKEPSNRGTLELEKHWYKFMLWGRLGYDNQLSNEHFIKMLANKYEPRDAFLLYTTWQAASKVVPQINRFMFHTGDRHWAPELCASRESFKYTPCFRIARPMPGNNIINPIKHQLLLSDNRLKSSTVTPPQIVDSLQNWSNIVLENIKKIIADNKQMKSIVADLEAFAWLGKYYAQKIRSAVLMEDIAANGLNSEKQSNLNKSMELATECWANYAEISDKYYYPQMYSRVNRLNWKEMEAEVLFDQEIVAKAYTEKSMKEQLKLDDKQLAIAFPYKNTKKWVRIKAPEAGKAEFILYDHRGEMVNFYTHACEMGESTLVWEDLSWMPKGKYTLVFYLNGKTAHCNIEI